MLAALLAPLLLGVTGASDTVLLDFRADWCGPCRAMEPVVQQLGAAGYPVRMVNIDQDRALAAQFHVSAIPCFVLIVDGHEVQRLVGPNDINTLAAMFHRAGYDPSGRASAIARNGGSSPNAAAATVSVDGGQAAFVQGPATSGVSADLSAGGPADPPASQVSSSVQPSRGGGQAGKLPLTDAQLLAACVRLKIADATGNSYGSGTIIDVRNGEALVLTCGHLFRDSDGKGDISVDLFGPGEPRQVPGRLVGCDLEKDVGLVSIPASVSLQEIHVAPPGYVLHVGDSVTTIGCSNGAPPTVQSSHVDSVGRFRGPPNFQVAGQPVQGRSGGGVVSADGLVIGVCNAADPEDNEGLYAALASIYKELDRAKLAFVYRPATSATASDAASPSGLVASAAQPSSSESAAPIAAAAIDRDLPAMPATMPAIIPPNASATTLASQSGKMAAGLTTDEAAALAELRDKARGAEVICIVRPLSDPHARSEIIVLDRASPEFLQKLAAERRCQTETRQLTSLEVPAASR